MGDHHHARRALPVQLKIVAERMQLPSSGLLGTCRCACTPAKWGGQAADLGTQAARLADQAPQTASDADTPACCPEVG
eukprot:7377672-Prymnesium_polylepis.1